METQNGEQAFSSQKDDTQKEEKAISNMETSAKKTVAETEKSQQKIEELQEEKSSAELKLEKLLKAQEKKEAKRKAQEDAIKKSRKKEQQEIKALAKAVEAEKKREARKKDAHYKISLGATDIKHSKDMFGDEYQITTQEIDEVWRLLQYVHEFNPNLSIQEICYLTVNFLDKQQRNGSYFSNYINKYRKG
jgi:phenylalanyl-tRNA synthetase alpha subunit